MESKFWNKVLKCKHKHINPNYYEFVSCSTPYCNGSEVHCLDCNVYISECSCGCNNGMNGWPYRRHVAQKRKKFKGKKENG